MFNPGERIFCEWENGKRLDSRDLRQFVNDLADMVRQFGTPSKVEVRRDKFTIHPHKIEAVRKRIGEIFRQELYREN